MKKQIFLLNAILFMVAANVYSQIGINTTTPHAQLEVAATNSSSPTYIDGLIIPKVNSLITSGMTSNQQSMLVYLTTTHSGNPPGFYYWDNSTTVWKPIGAAEWSLTGNAGTTVDTNFLGTTDDEDLMFKRNNLIAGYIGNTSNDNTAFGLEALANYDDASNNTAIGRAVLKANTTGNNNTGIGRRALTANETGSNNVAVGNAVLNINTDGAQNVAVGNNSLEANVSGNYNTSVGHSATNQKGAGSQNTALGAIALYDLTSGSNNIAIGYNAQVPNSTGSNQVRLGNADMTIVSTTVSWTTTSDKRLKNNIQHSGLGLNFIKEINPVSYFRNNDKGNKTEYGFIAQEIEQLLNKFGDTNNGIINIDDSGMYSVRYNDFIPISVKAIQEQQQIIEQEKDKNQKLQERVNNLEKRLSIIEAKLMKGNASVAENK